MKSTKGLCSRKTTGAFDGSGLNSSNHQWRVRCTDHCSNCSPLIALGTFSFTPCYSMPRLSIVLNKRLQEQNITIHKRLVNQQ